MNRQELFAQIKKKGSFLCVGLDTDIQKIPPHLLREEDPIFEFNKQIIDATADYCVAYKPNIAFYESRGIKGWESLQKTLNYIPKEHFTIADAKRGDIGNTSKMYAQTFFETFEFDSVTIAPYMGSDSVEPFLTFPDKWVILLALTSNPGSMDFQLTKDAQGKELYKKVLETSKQWGDADNLMYVVGATRAEYLAEIRQIVPDNFLLIPGVGAQGGSLAEVAKYGMNQHCGLLVNSSRAIIYKSNEYDFAEKAQNEAKIIRMEMQELLDKYL
jgi:orotidine-5'-phosphate decarboxylase